VKHAELLLKKNNAIINAWVVSLAPFVWNANLNQLVDLQKPVLREFTVAEPAV